MIQEMADTEPNSSSEMSEKRCHLFGAVQFRPVFDPLCCAALQARSEKSLDNQTIFQSHMIVERDST
ncbi:hypothetical protein [Deinococcus wulumuqiensis]|uniref:hypothetical protein n=1 Tax=Deinococcus wulumuqiensis TaxID=980427 RepID=UPI0013C33B86|nr:hypothetical protein [Deinococcus wulumuqiensis]